MQSSIFLRDKSIYLIRQYFYEMGIIETMTSALSKYSGIEPFLDPPKVIYNDNERSHFYLRTSPEFSLKKHLCLFYKQEKGIYEIARAFRDERNSSLHAPEFTMIEWYENATDYNNLPRRIIDITKKILEIKCDVKNEIQENFLNNEYFIYSVEDIFFKVLGIKITSSSSIVEYQSIADAHNISLQFLNNVPVDLNETYIEWQKIQYFNLIFDHIILPAISEGIWFIKDFPAFGRGMANLNKDGWSERVECYVNGVEIANGYQEMYDIDDLKHLWLLNSQLRQLENKPPHLNDDLLLEITPLMKNVTGMALGLDRLVMLLFNINNIHTFSID